LQELSDSRPAHIVTADLTGNHRGARPEEDPGLLEELLVHLLDVQSLLNPAANAVADHQARELVAIDENYSLAQLFGCLTCRR
jgi:hypothetical protein